jgi:hypothetical protein
MVSPRQVWKLVLHLTYQQQQLTLGVGKWAASVGVWGTIEGVVAKRKVMYWERVKGLQRGRWPREALQWVVETPYESELWRSLMAARVALTCLNLDGVIKRGG